jgi:glycerophosphoryl diester phosphodiesterase
MIGEIKEKFFLVGHRGASAYELENTMKSFRRAFEMGCDAVEMDLRRTKDDEIVVIHDEDLSRVAKVNLKVREVSLRELKGIQLINGESVPTLEEVLSQFNGKNLFLEIKEKGFEGKLVELVKREKMLDNVLFISFDYESLKKVSDLGGKYIGLLFFKPPFPIEEGRKIKAFSLLPRVNLVNPRNVKIMKKGFTVITWVVNDPTQLRRAKESGCNGFVTDKPDISKEEKSLEKFV